MPMWQLLLPALLERACTECRVASTTMSGYRSIPASAEPNLCPEHNENTLPLIGKHTET